ncbi:hypothetical protein NDU88_011908 [Pleurodeles waltl]|uniref:Uncharacterized protein n=1 Tax=Pleurodeles waltl TaxID=8319 RepID=A0AAV7R1T3_PLEWA|nr:hypothetical protein NDU88_011908 [Pleurodeles waltl]
MDRVSPGSCICWLAALGAGGVLRALPASGQARGGAACSELPGCHKTVGTGEGFSLRPRRQEVRGGAGWRGPPQSYRTMAPREVVSPGWAWPGTTRLLCGARLPGGVRRGYRAFPP